jgi:hypothetical protein
MFSSLHRNDRLLSDHRPEINESNFGSVVRHPFFVKKTERSSELKMASFLHAFGFTAVMVSTVENLT